MTSTPTAARSRQVDELKATITAQDQTISTLQAQFASLRVSHEAHVASLVDAHAAEIASLRNYTKALEDQQSQRTLHHGRETPSSTRLSSLFGADILLSVEQSPFVSARHHRSTPITHS